jgi:hypothetical protein
MCHDYAYDANEYRGIAASLKWRTEPESYYTNIKSSIDANNLEEFNHDVFKKVLWGSFIKK